jgi:quinol monooxygenase YgiN
MPILARHFMDENRFLTTFGKSITINNETMYLLHGKLNAKAGHAEDLANILLEASTLVSTAKGCKIYVVAKDAADLNAVYVTEIWDSKEDHDNSLNVEGVRELISKAMPIFDGKPTRGQELEILGGAGV